MLVAGNNQVLALTSSGTVLSWGSGQQGQLGRRLLERRKLNSLIPQDTGLPKAIVDIGVGADHSFAIHQNGKIYGCGLNNYGEVGIAEEAGEDV